MFEEKYTELIEPLYGEKRKEATDKLLLEEKCQNPYKIVKRDRMDLTAIEIYNIDPDNCTDVDDAFSIYRQDDILYLAIHIADPTDYISLESHLWKDIVQRVTTKYPTNRESISLLPEPLVEKCSLCKNNISDIKKAITIKVKIDENTFETIGEPDLYFSIVRVNEKNCYSYFSASRENNFIDGIKIMQRMKLNRSKMTKTTKLNDISFLQYRFVNDEINIYTETKEEKLMKEMIAEFAIFANSFIGRYMKRHLECAIFRSCPSKDFLSTISDSSTGNEILYKIIMCGVSAKYESNDKSHDLVGTPIYSHFTSPIRRLSDLICHYFLKFIHKKNVPPPFSKEDLDFLTKKCLSEAKKDKKIQHNDKKFRTLQIIKNIIQNEGSVMIEFFCTSYTGMFLNVIISKVKDYNTHVAYTLRIQKSKKQYDFGKKESIKITKINCFQKYDENTFPELDHYLF